MTELNQTNRRRSLLRPRFSLKALLIFMLAICIAVGTRTRSVNRQLEATAKLKQVGARFDTNWYDWPGPNRLWYRVNSWLSLDLTWPRRFLGQWGCLDAYAYVQLIGPSFGDQSIGDVASLPHLFILEITSELDPGFQPSELSRLQNIEQLYMQGNWVTDAHLDALVSLRRLKVVGVYSGGIDERAVSRLLTRRPDLRISYEGTTEEVDDYFNSGWYQDRLRKMRIDQDTANRDEESPRR